MGTLLDVTGQRYGNLTAVSEHGRDNYGRATWLFRCDCGSSAVLGLNNVRTGNTKSCGCLKHRKGKDNPKTITNIERLRERGRRLYVHKHWIREQKSACPLCSKCGSRENLHAHHIEGYADRPDLRTDWQNGVVLCADCHISFHVKYGRRSGFSEEDLNEWLIGDRGKAPRDNRSVLLGEFHAEIVFLAANHSSNEDVEKIIHYAEMLREAYYGEVQK